MNATIIRVPNTTTITIEFKTPVSGAAFVEVEDFNVAAYDKRGEGVTFTPEIRREVERLLFGEG